MAKWIIEQRADVWYRTEVEAETFEEAIEQSQKPSADWSLRTEYTEWQDDFWGMNEETEKTYSMNSYEVVELD